MAGNTRNGRPQVIKLDDGYQEGPEFHVLKRDARRVGNSHGKAL